MISNIEQFTEFKDSFVGKSASFASLTCDGGSFCMLKQRTDTDAHQSQCFGSCMIITLP